MSNRIEDTIRAKLTGDAQANALSLVAHIRANNLVARCPY